MDERTSGLELLQHTDTVNELLARYGVKFGIYKNQVFREPLTYSNTAVFKLVVREDP